MNRFLLVLMLSATGAAAQERWVPDEIQVKFKTGAAAPAMAGALSGVSGSISYGLQSGWQVIKLNGMSVAAAEIYLRNLGVVEDVAPNYLYRPSTFPDDPQVEQQYHHESINAFAGWEFEKGLSTTVVIAVIDTGILSTHEDLSARVNVASSSRVSATGAVTSGISDPNVACSGFGHGTNSSGMAGATGNNAIGVTGINWAAELISINVFSACGDATNAQLAKAIDTAVSVAGGRRMVINMSLGGVDACTSGGLPASIQAAAQAGHLIVAAAGNQDTFNPTKVVECPATNAEVIAVGATTSSGGIASFSAQGSELDVVAPGQSVRSTDGDGGYASSISGTSFSAPIVAGLASIMFAANPGISSTTVRDNLRASAVDLGADGFDTVFGFGQVDAYRALRLTVKGTLSGSAGEAKVQPFPLPFKRGTHSHVTFAIPSNLQGSNPVIQIYTQSGEVVRILDGKSSWDVKNEQGNPVAAGVYVFRFKSDSGQTTGRVLIQ